MNHDWDYKFDPIDSGVPVCEICGENEADDHRWVECPDEKTCVMQLWVCPPCGKLAAADLALIVKDRRAA